jgi:hypothetical protein
LAGGRIGDLCARPSDPIIDCLSFSGFPTLDSLVISAGLVMPVSVLFSKIASLVGQVILFFLITSRKYTMPVPVVNAFRLGLSPIESLILVLVAKASHRSPK